jgi:hypothetical protein
MDVNRIKAAIQTTNSVSEIRTILKTAFDNNIVLGTQYLKTWFYNTPFLLKARTALHCFVVVTLKLMGIAEHFHCPLTDIRLGR